MLVELFIFFPGSGGSGENIEIFTQSGTDCNDDDDEDCDEGSGGNVDGMYINVLGLFRIRAGVQVRLILYARNCNSMKLLDIDISNLLGPVV